MPFRLRLFLYVFVFNVFYSVSQTRTSILKAQFALGGNKPLSEGFMDGFNAKLINFPSINLGIQYMFKPKFGTKLDFGYNRFSNKKNTLEFKVNYTRINGQIVYDITPFFSFLTPRIATYLHTGLGHTTIKPLGFFTENNTSFFNAIGGVEFHYGVSDKLSVYFDTLYVHSFSKKFNPVSEGFGSFNGNLITLTIGASISPSGCQYCD